MKYLSISINIFLISIAAFIGCNRPCSAPDKPVIVPAQAEWIGGCDGGHWIQLISDTNNYHFKIFRDWDGALEMDAIFVSEHVIDLNMSNWKEKVSSFGTHPSNDTLMCIYFKTNEESKKLTAIYPAFGGETWNIIKEKYNIK